MSEPDRSLVPAPTTAAERRLSIALERSRSSARRLEEGLRSELERRFGWRSVVRRHPLACMAAAVVVGFALGRRW